MIIHKGTTLYSSFAAMQAKTHLKRFTKRNNRMRGIKMNVLLFFRHGFFALPKETPRINTVFNVQKHISSVKSVPKFT